MNEDLKLKDIFCFEGCFYSILEKENVFEYLKSIHISFSDKLGEVKK